MKTIAQVFLFDRDNRLLIYLRDDKPDIPYPNHWDFFGGHVEAGETPEQALVREVREELGIELPTFSFFHRYECMTGDAYPNVKYLYSSGIPNTANELVLNEGQQLIAIPKEERANFRFANILGEILEDFIAAGCWPVDNFSSCFLPK